MRALLAALLVLAAPDPFTVEAKEVPAVAKGVIRIEATVAGSRASRIEFVVDGWLRHTERQASYVFEWDTARELDGRHRVELWAVAEDGRVATATVDVRVSNALRVTVGGVRDGARVSGRVPLRASVNGPQPQWVELLVDGKVRDIDTKPPYATTWDTAAEAPGRHTVSLWAVAPNGVVSRSSAVVSVRGLRASDSLNAARQVGQYRDDVRRCEALMRLPHHAPGAGAGGDTVDWWRRRAQDIRARGARPPHLEQFLCIHRYEGAWTARTGNGYYGGLQVNMDFMRAYGPQLLATKGTADKWTPIEQIWVAERAVSRRGFNPWPQTARMCGLL